jgi:nucleoside 2-deoxyribosyltransferase
MKIYVAGKWSDKKIIQSAMDCFKLLGHQITYDWTQNETQTRSSEELSKFAYLDMKGVMDADLLIAIMNDEKYEYRGTFTEIGGAIATGKKIFIYCPKDNYYCCTNCFFHHPNIKHYQLWNDLLIDLEKLD